MDIIKTERLVLRPYLLSDADALYVNLGMDEESYRYTGWNPYESVEMTEGIIKERMEDFSLSQTYNAVITLDGEIIGTVAAFDYDEDKDSLELGYAIFRTYWNHGYAKEAVKAFIKEVLKHHKGLHAWVHEDNEASKKVLLSCGFTYGGKVSDGLTNFDGSFADQWIYVLDR